jgi:hypothetical protein
MWADTADSDLSKLISRPPVLSLYLDLSSTNIGTSDWVELTSSLTVPVTAVEIFCGSGAILQIATGAAASESAIPYRILPGGSAVLIPLGLAKGTRLSAKAVNMTADTGQLVLNFFG